MNIIIEQQIAKNYKLKLMEILDLIYEVNRPTLFRKKDQEFCCPYAITELHEIISSYLHTLGNTFSNSKYCILGNYLNPEFNFTHKILAMILFYLYTTVFDESYGYLKYIKMSRHQYKYWSNLAREFIDSTYKLDSTEELIIREIGESPMAFNKPHIMEYIKCHKLESVTVEEMIKKIYAINFVKNFNSYVPIVAKRYNGSTNDTTIMPANYFFNNFCYKYGSTNYFDFYSFLAIEENLS